MAKKKNTFGKIVAVFIALMFAVSSVAFTISVLLSK